MMFLLLNLNIGANDVDNNKYNVGVVDVSSHSPTLPWPKKCDARSRCSDVDIDNIKVDIENIKGLTMLKDLSAMQAAGLTGG